MFKEKPTIGRKGQAQKSLDIRETRRASISEVPHDRLVEMNQQQAAKLAEMDPNLVADYVYFQRTGIHQPVYIPKEYAKLLQRTKQGTIVDRPPMIELTEAQKAILQKSKAPKSQSFTDMFKILKGEE
jgi:hypothetical protein